jgi:hypothetical protein
MEDKHVPVASFRGLPSDEDEIRLFPDRIVVGDLTILLDRVAGVSVEPVTEWAEESSLVISVSDGEPLMVTLATPDARRASALIERSTTSPRAPGRAGEETGPDPRSPAHGRTAPNTDSQESATRRMESSIPSTPPRARWSWRGLRGRWEISHRTSPISPPGGADAPSREPDASVPAMRRTELHPYRPQSTQSWAWVRRAIRRWSVRLERGGRRTAVVAALLVFCLVAVVVLDAYRQAYDIYKDLRSAFPQLEEIRSSVGNGRAPSLQQVDALESVVTSAQRQVDLTHVDFRLLGNVPILGRPVNAARHAVDAVREETQATRIIRTLLISLFGDRVTSETGGGTVTPVYGNGRFDLQLIRSLVPNLSSLLLHLQAAYADIRSIKRASRACPLRTS